MVVTSIFLEYFTDKEFNYIVRAKVSSDSKPFTDYLIDTNYFSVFVPRA